VDRYRDGDRTALSAEELRGQRVFRGPGLCTTCHQGSTFTDEDFHNTGVAWNGARFTDEGRGAVTGKTDDRGAFKTPTLREVAPLSAVHAQRQPADTRSRCRVLRPRRRPNPQLDKEDRAAEAIAADKAALVAFLKALTGHDYRGPARALTRDAMCICNLQFAIGVGLQWFIAGSVTGMPRSWPPSVNSPVSQRT
jgi:cytochrome c peroxidase